MHKTYRSTHAAALAGLLLAAAFLCQGAQASVISLGGAERDPIPMGLNYQPLAQLEALHGQFQRSAAQWTTVPTAFVQTPYGNAGRSNIWTSQDRQTTPAWTSNSTALQVLMGLALCAVVVRRRRHRI